MINGLFVVMLVFWVKSFKFHGKLKLEDLYKIASENGELDLQSGKQELFENIINQHI